MSAHNTRSTPIQDAPGSYASALARAGGVAGHVVAGSYVVGFIAMLAYLAPRGYTDPITSPADSLDFLSAHSAAMYGWYLILYLVGGAALPVLVLALHERTGRAGSAPSAVARVFGLIWGGLLLASGMIALIGQRAVLSLAEGDRAAAVTSWHAVSVIQDALGGGIEVIGALWVLLLCITAYRSRGLPRPLAVLGILLGLVGICTLVPLLADPAASVFGLGLIIWLTWTATLLTRPAPRGLDPGQG